MGAFSRSKVADLLLLSSCGAVMLALGWGAHYVRIALMFCALWLAQRLARKCGARWARRFQVGPPSPTAAARAFGSWCSSLVLQRANIGWSALALLASAAHSVSELDRAPFIFPAEIALWSWAGGGAGAGAYCALALHSPLLRSACPDFFSLASYALGAQVLYPARLALVVAQSAASCGAGGKCGVFWFAALLAVTMAALCVAVRGSALLSRARWAALLAWAILTASSVAAGKEAAIFWSFVVSVPAFCPK